MQSQNKDAKLKEFISTPIGLVVVLIIIILVISFFVLLIQGIASRRSEGITAEYDEAAKQEVYFAPATNGSGSKDIVRYVGLFDILMKSNVTPAQYVALQNSISAFASENNINLTRVSYVDDSLLLSNQCNYNFDIALNEEQNYLNVTLDATKDCAGTDDLIINIERKQNGE